MEKLNITKGTWEVAEGTIENGGGLYAVKSEEWDIASTFYIGFDEGDAHDNAKLIADAGTTYNQCGFLPSELKAQKEELLNFIEKYQKEMFSENGCLTGQDWKLFQDIIQKYKSNE